MATDGAEDEENVVETFEDEEMASESVEDEMPVVETDDSDAYVDMQSDDDKSGTTHDEADDEENSNCPSDNEVDSEGLVQGELDDGGHTTYAGISKTSTALMPDAVGVAQSYLGKSSTSTAFQDTPPARSPHAAKSLTAKRRSMVITYTFGYVHLEASADNDGGSSDDE
ncbi:hypothetical protein KI688_010175 [Linnemannia hyalina]|uniref:Uncharacterized protein n=1 Tax=Linnemannia hyalina TaxID=64524 RepID=A0A9P7XY24_9FUNG|nr:hypothetical protein KI688_010175 [Linnemannia hyalina]